MFGRASTPPNQFWTCCSTNLQLLCGSFVELDSQFGAEEMCLAEIIAPALKIEIML
jgi:hypothetical protein